MPVQYDMQVGRGMHGLHVQYDERRHAGKRWHARGLLFWCLTRCDAVEGVSAKLSRSFELPKAFEITNGSSCHVWELAREGLTL